MEEHRCSCNVQQNKFPGKLATVLASVRSKRNCKRRGGRASYDNFLKVAVHLEQCFQFSVCNSVNTHPIPTNVYVNGKLMKLSK